MAKSHYPWSARVARVFVALKRQQIQFKDKDAVLRQAREAIEVSPKDRTKEQRESVQTVHTALAERMRELCQRLLELESAAPAKSKSDTTMGQRMRQYLEDMDKTAVQLRSLNNAYDVALRDFQAAVTAYDAKYAQTVIDPLAVMRDDFSFTDALHVRKMLQNIRCASPRCQGFVEFMVSPGSPIDENLVRSSQCDSERRRVIYKALVNVVPVMLKMWMMSNEKDKKHVMGDISQKFDMVRALGNQIEQAHRSGAEFYEKNSALGKGGLAETLTDTCIASMQKMKSGVDRDAWTRKLKLAQHKVDSLADMWATFTELSFNGPQKSKARVDDLYVPVLNRHDFGWLPTKRLRKKMSFMDAKSLGMKPRVLTPDSLPKRNIKPAKMTYVHQDRCPPSHCKPNPFVPTSDNIPHRSVVLENMTRSHHNCGPPLRSDPYPCVPMPDNSPQTTAALDKMTRHHTDRCRPSLRLPYSRSIDAPSFSSQQPSRHPDHTVPRHTNSPLQRSALFAPQASWSLRDVIPTPHGETSTASSEAPIAQSPIPSSGRIDRPIQQDSSRTPLFHAFRSGSFNDGWVVD